jgi:hypothetical protein
MPYISDEQRNDIDNLGFTPSDVGELNYVLTKTCITFLKRKGDEPRYNDFNDCLGALEACKLELYRRMVGPYEDQKQYENGDVFNV